MMELWVRSQNKKTLSKVEMIGIENDEKSIYMQNQDMFERLGTYETKELLESLKVFWKKYTPDNSLEIGQIERVIKTLDGVGSE